MSKPVASKNHYDNDEEEYVENRDLSVDIDDDHWYDDDDIEEDFEDEEEKSEKGVVINYSLKVDTAIYNVFFSYFNYKKNNPKNNVEDYDGVVVQHMIQSSYLISNIPEPAPSLVDYKITITFDGLDMLLRFNSYIEMDHLQSYLHINSLEKSQINGDAVFNKIFALALSKSSLKGGYITMPDNKFTWDLKPLEKMTYDDIFLPDDLMTQAKLFVKLFKAKGLMSKYLLSGIPGSGKTELTRVLSSLLKEEDGVTIIKTNPCEVFKRKVDLAKALAPAIIILDDVDLYLGNRNNGSYSFLLGQFLDVLDGVDKLPDNIGIIASTNAPHLIDMAAQRPGRFNKLLFFTSITKDNIRGIINKSLNKLAQKYGPIDQSIQDKFLDDKLVDFFKSSESSGSYIYETVIDIKNSMDVNDENDFCVDELVKRLTKEKKNLKDNLKIERIDNSFKEVNKSMGFK